METNIGDLRREIIRWAKAVKEANNATYAEMVEALEGAREYFELNAEMEDE